jgi:zinc/manganese transport system ATP-binding protein
MGADMKKEILRFENLTLGYERHPAVHHLDFSVRRGAMLAVAGPNGAGKSTLLKGITRAIKPLGGSIRLCGIKHREIAYLPQRTSLDITFPITVFDMVAMGMWQAVGAFGGFGKKRNARVAQALHRVGMTGMEHRPIGTLSGGQAQRALFARLLLQDASLILLDEPFNAIDSTSVRDLMALIHSWHEEGKTILVVLHDLNLIRSAFSETILLARELVAGGPTDKVLSAYNLNQAQRLCDGFETQSLLCEKG